MNDATRIFQFKKHYLAAATLVLMIEIAIALWVRDAFVRPYVGDFLVSVLLYLLFVGIFAANRFLWAAAALVICFVVEFLQAFDFVARLGLSNCALARTVLGTSFEPMDLAAYTLGILSVVATEQWLTRRKAKYIKPNRPTSIEKTSDDAAV